MHSSLLMQNGNSVMHLALTVTAVVAREHKQPNSSEHQDSGLRGPVTSETERLQRHSQLQGGRNLVCHVPDERFGGIHHEGHDRPQSLFSTIKHVSHS